MCFYSLRKVEIGKYVDMYVDVYTLVIIFAQGLLMLRHAASGGKAQSTSRSKNFPSPARTNTRYAQKKVLGGNLSSRHRRRLL